MKETQTSYTLNQEEKKEYDNGFKSDQTEKIGNTETIILGKQNYDCKTSLPELNDEVVSAFVHLPLFCHGCSKAF